jgi:hypothetical protein
MRRKRLHLFPLISTLLLFSIFSHAQNWSGILSSSRAIDWSKAGLGIAGYAPGALPSDGWTQCGSTIAAYGSSESPASPSTINTALANCTANHYVQLGAGTFYLNSGIWAPNNYTELRGMGANSTLLVFTGENGCNGQYSEFCAAGSNTGFGNNYANWTAGYSQGATQITLANSTNIVANSTVLLLQQVDEASDTGNIWNCTVAACGSFGGGGQNQTDGPCTSSLPCSQEQEVLVTACSPSCNYSGSTVVTITPGLYMNNWRSGQSPFAEWPTTEARQIGVKDISFDLTNAPSGTQTIVLMHCYECWAVGNRSVYAARNHIWLWGGAHNFVGFNYLYQSTSHEAVSYAIETYAGSSDNLILSNICQQVTDSCPNNNGGGSGNVSLYNFGIDDVYGGTGWFQPDDYDHAAGQSFWLREGNSGLGVIADLVHGTHHFTTAFRNYYSGWASSGCGNAGQTTCTGNTTAVNFWGGSRYFNIVGNVLGQAGYDTIYGTYGYNGRYSYQGGGTNQNLSVYYIGQANGGNGNGTFCSNPPTCNTTSTVYDVIGITSLLRWGNYDAVTNAVRLCKASSGAPCAGDETASGFSDSTGTPSIYAALSNPNQTLPNSFFMSGIASTTSASPCGTGWLWWKNPTRGTCEPFPPIGPDISNGDMGQCASGTYQGNACRVGSTQCGTGISCNQAMAGHANLNPARSCFLDVMGGYPDGTNSSVLTYNRASCYANDPSGDPAIAPPTGLSAVVQ